MVVKNFFFFFSLILAYTLVFAVPASAENGPPPDASGAAAAGAPTAGGPPPAGLPAGNPTVGGPPIGQGQDAGAPSAAPGAGTDSDATASTDSDDSSKKKKTPPPDLNPVKQIQGETKNLTLGTGISRTLEFNFDIGSIHVGTDDPPFVYQRIGEGDRVRKLRMIPKQAGYTDMTIYDTQNVPRITYFVRVTREDQGEVVGELEDLLGDIEGLKIRTVGGSIILDGEILLPKDMVRIIRAIDAIKERDAKKEIPIKNLCTISKVTMNILAERIEREIGSPEITARVINNVLFLEGTAEREFEADRAVQIARAYLPEAFVEKAKGEGGEVRPKKEGGIAGGMPGIVDMMSVRPPAANPPGQDIKITMNYVELTNDYSKSFSFNWNPLVSDNSTVKYDTSVGSLTADLFATVTGLLPKLDFERSHGHARILKQEQVIVKDRSDTPAVIQNSIQYYTRIVDQNGNPSLQAVPVENVTKVKAATIPGSDSIDLGIQISMDALAGTNQGNPVVSKNMLQTQVTIKNGDSAALGGYGVDQIVANYNRAPGSSVPGTDASGNTVNASNSASILPLQRSKDYQHSKQQYIIFLTPEVIRTAAAGTEDMTRKFRLNAGER